MTILKQFGRGFKSSVKKNLQQRRRNKKRSNIGNRAPLAGMTGRLHVSRDDCKTSLGVFHTSLTEEAAIDFRIANPYVEEREQQ